VEMVINTAAFYMANSAMTFSLIIANCKLPFQEVFTVEEVYQLSSPKSHNREGGHRQNEKHGGMKQKSGKSYVKERNQMGKRINRNHIEFEENSNNENTAKFCIKTWKIIDKKAGFEQCEKIRTRNKTRKFRCKRNTAKSYECNERKTIRYLQKTWNKV
jgi:hypothetical protein